MTSVLKWSLSGMVCCGGMLLFAAGAPAQDAAEKKPGPAGEQESKQQAGQAAFDQVCKVCHGPEAQGDGGPGLVPFSRGYDELLGIVREGTGQMPPISARELPDDGVAQIVEYLKSLSQ